jgi:hypothetical protein
MKESVVGMKGSLVIEAEVLEVFTDSNERKMLKIQCELGEHIIPDTSFVPQAPKCACGYTNHQDFPFCPKCGVAQDG